MWSPHHTSGRKTGEKYLRSLGGNRLSNVFLRMKIPGTLPHKIIFPITNSFECRMPREVTMLLTGLALSKIWVSIAFLSALYKKSVSISTPGPSAKKYSTVPGCTQIHLHLIVLFVLGVVGMCNHLSRRLHCAISPGPSISCSPLLLSHYYTNIDSCACS